MAIAFEKKQQNILESFETSLQFLIIFQENGFQTKFIDTPICLKHINRKKLL